MDPNQYPRPPQQGGPPQMTAPSQGQPFPYDPTSSGGHFGAASQVAQSGYIPATAQFNSTFANVTQGLQGQYRNVLATYWQHVIYEIENDDHDFKVHQLPLARIKVTEPPPLDSVRLLTPPESHEIRRGREDDLCRGPHPVCQGLRYLHHGTHYASMDPRRRIETAHAPTLRHRPGHLEIRHVRLPDRHRPPRSLAATTLRHGRRRPALRLPETRGRRTARSESGRKRPWRLWLGRIWRSCRGRCGKLSIGSVGVYRYSSGDKCGTKWTVSSSSWSYAV